MVRDRVVQRGRLRPPRKVEKLPLIFKELEARPGDVQLSESYAQYRGVDAVSVALAPCFSHPIAAHLKL